MTDCDWISAPQHARGQAAGQAAIRLSAPSAPAGIHLGTSLADTQEALRAAYRLSPDQRFLRAVADVHRLLSEHDRDGEGQAATASFQTGPRRWAISYGDTSVGSLPEMADFDDALNLLSAWALTLAGPAPQHPAAFAEGPLPAFAEDALPALRKLDEKSRGGHKGHKALEDIPSAAQALTSLAFTLTDTMGVADAVAARALAATALARAQGQPLARTTGLLAHTLGYTAAAHRLAADLAQDDPLRAYLLDNDDDLARLARTPQDHLLRWRQMVADHDMEHEGDYRLLHFPTRQLALTLLSGRLLLGDFFTNRQVGQFMPMLLLHSVENVDSPILPQIHTAKDLEIGVLQVVSLYQKSPGALLKRYQGELAKLPVAPGDPFLGPDVARQYYVSLMHSAIWSLGTFYMDQLSSQWDAEQFAKAMGPAEGTVFAPVARLFDLLSRVKTGAAGPQAAQTLLDALSLPAEFGGGPFYRVTEGLTELLGFDDPNRLTAVRRLSARLDGRPEHQHILAAVAFGLLYDVHLTEDLARNLQRIEVGRHGGNDAWMAGFLGDTDALRAISRNAGAGESARVHAILRLDQRGLLKDDERRRLVLSVLGKDHDDWPARDTLVRHLEKSRDYQDASAIITDWLSRYGAETRFHYIFARTALARQLYYLKRYQEAWDAVQPVLESGQSGAMQRGALILQALGKKDEALRLARQIVERYPDNLPMVGTFAEILWRAGDPEGAARLLAHPPRPISLDSWSWVLAKPFADALGDDPGAAAAAVAALRTAGVPTQAIVFLASSNDVAKHPALAFEILSHLRLTGGADVELALSAYAALSKSRGQEAARPFIQERLADDLTRLPLDMIYGLSFSHKHYELLWDLLPEPGAPGPTTDAIWLSRASGALLADHKDAAHLAALKAYFADPGHGTTYYHALGKYLMGLLPEGDALKLAHDPHTSCEVAYYLGVRAQGEGRLRDASDFYRAAVETQSRRDGEFHWAFGQLLLWVDRDVALPNDGSATDGTKATQAGGAAPGDPPARDHKRRKGGKHGRHKKAGAVE